MKDSHKNKQKSKYKLTMIFNDLHDLINRINYNATYREYVRFITQYTKDVDILFKLHTRQILKTERIMF